MEREYTQFDRETLSKLVEVYKLEDDIESLLGQCNDSIDKASRLIQQARELMERRERLLEELD